MILFLLAVTGVLLLGSIAAFFLYVSLLSIGAVLSLLVAMLLMFGLGVGIASGYMLHDKRKMRPVMTKIDLKKFKDALTARQSELEGLIRNRDAAAIETSADALDQIQHMVERELALETLGRESAFLRETRAAPAVWMRAPLESASTVRKRSIRSGLPRYRGPPAVSPARNVRIAKAPQSGTPTNRCCRKPRNRDCEPERPGCRDHGRSRDHRRLGSGC
jgi:hypothetical protein